MELRRQYEAAEPLDPVEDEAEDLAGDFDDDDGEHRPAKAKKKKAPAKAKAKTTKATKAAKPSARMRIVWTVVNDAFKTVGTFPFAEREAAEARAAELTAKGKGVHFIQKVKEPMPDDAPGLGAAIPRVATATPAADEAAAPAKAGKAAPVVDDEEIEDDDDALTDDDEADDDDDGGDDDE
jgi:hypothetical protein